MGKTAPRQFRLVVNNRQMVLASFLLIVLMWMFAAATYLAASVASPPAVEAKSVAEQPVTVIDPIAGVSAVVTPAAKAPEPETASAAVGVGGAGSLYLQFTVINEDLARVYADYLERQSISAFTSEAPDGRRNWVLVGPVRDSSQLGVIRAKLAAAGFTSE